MESFGAYLKGLREEKGKTQEQISDSTKIALSNLALLESDRYDLLPPRVFVKGFIRSYMRDLELNPDEALGRFDEFVKQGELPDYSEEEHPVFHQKPVSGAFIHNPWFTVVLTAAGVVSLIVLLTTGITRLFLSNGSSKAKLPTVTTVQPSRERSPVSSQETNQESLQTSFDEQPGNQDGKKILEIRAVSKAWVRVEPDNGPPEELMMAPDEIQIFTAKSSFHLQTGNAGGLRLRFEGRELPSLGKVNQTLSLTLP
jgi:cytoskeletal protein RodZ